MRRGHQKSGLRRVGTPLLLLGLIAGVIAPGSPAQATQDEWETPMDTGVVVDAPASVVVGKVFDLTITPTYDETVADVADQDDRIDVDLTVPAGLRILDTTRVEDWYESCGRSGALLTCTTAIYVNGPRTLKAVAVSPGPIDLEFAVRGPHPEPDPDPSPNQVTVTIDATAGTTDVGATAPATLPTAHAGAPVDWTVALTNAGNDWAANTTVSWELPTGTAVGAISLAPLPKLFGDDDPAWSDGTCSAAGSTITCTGVNLRPGPGGVPSQRTLTARITPAVAGTSSTTVTIDPAPAQTDPTPDPTSNSWSTSVTIAPPIAGAVAGTVRAFGTDAPVAGVAVEAFGAADATTPTASVTSGPAGTFTFPALPAGAYALRYVDGDAGGYAPQWLRADGAGTTRAGALTVTAPGDGSTVTAPTMTLVDLDRNHVDLGVDVSLPPTLAPGEEVTRNVTPQQGRWRVDGVWNRSVDDDVLVVTSSADLTITSLWAHGEEVGPCQVETAQRAVCENPGTDVYLGLRAGASGRATVTATYSSSATEASPQGLANTMSASATVQTPTARFGFVVHDERHQPVAGADVWAYVDGDTWLPSVPQAYETTDALGNVLFEDLPAGTYKLMVRPASSSGLPVQWLGGATREAVNGFTFPGGFDLVTTADLMPHLVIPRRISGVVTAGGAPVQGVKVRAFSAGVAWMPAATAITAADGSYLFTGLAPGRYELLFEPAAGSGRGAVWYGGSANRSGATVIDLISDTNPRPGVDQALPQRGVVEGTITSASGPVAGARIVFFAPGDTFGGSHEVATGPDGRFATSTLPAGTYTIRIVPPTGSGLAVEWFDDTPDRALAAPVVAGPSPVDVSAMLAP